MKNIILLMTTFVLFSFSCSKPKKKEIERLKAKIELMSPNGGESFSSTQSIKVSWKSNNVPAGSLVVASLVHQVPGCCTLSAYIVPQNKQNIFLFDKEIIATANDGTEVFQLPDGSDDVYRSSFGPEYKVKLIVAFKSKDGTWTTASPDVGSLEAQSKSFFTILK